jgi:hypothetical protein
MLALALIAGALLGLVAVMPRRLPLPLIIGTLILLVLL